MASSPLPVDINDCSGGDDRGGGIDKEDEGRERILAFFLADWADFA
ncbi:MAG: hypothetical protein HQK57_03950 [Deltaproteobacteria bacterium]|nr:hypothetical protein [Deltaproteobacteria bacterium]